MNTLKHAGQNRSMPATCQGEAMQPVKLPEDDGLIMQCLAPDQFDVVLGSHPGRQKISPTRSSWSVGSIVICLALIAAVAYLLVQLFSTPKSVPAVVPPTSTAEIIEAPTPVAQAADIRTTEQVVYVAPRPDTSQPVETKPLDDCLKNGNVIDRDVVNCRFGEAQPTDYNTPRPQGMVSERYMAQYKSTAAKPKADSGRHYEVAGVFIREIDGRNRYQARYRIYNNHIENSSVCMNFLSDSVEHRECRRAAEPYFKDMCSDWTKRAAKDRDQKSKLAQEQYCEAARTYQAN
jgi:hypothetical protein